MKKKSALFLFIVVLLASLSTVPKSVYGQTSNLEGQFYVPNQVLVTYKEGVTDYFFQDESKELKQPSFFERLRQFFFGPSKTVLKGKEIRSKYLELKDKLGIIEHKSLERIAYFPEEDAKTIKLGTFEVTRESEKPITSDPLKNVYLLTFTKVSVPQAIEILKNSGIVEEVQPNFIYQLFASPNDPFYPQQWGLKAIEMEKAWEIKRENEVVVAVVDTGVDYTHEDLKDNMWSGVVNGKTTVGWDFVNNTSDPFDNFGHGTRVAGQIAAIGNNAVGIAGTNWRTKIMALKASNSIFFSTDIIGNAIRFAADNGANVINLSLGSLDGESPCSINGENLPDNKFSQAIQYATRDRGAIVVVAAGNSRGDAACYFPANHPDVLIATAINNSSKPSSFSNYADISWKEQKVIAAPGGEGSSVNCTADTCILTTSPNNQYAAVSGTSFAAPIVSGIAALTLSVKALDPFSLRDHLVKTADEISTDFELAAGQGKKTYGKRINAYNALSSLLLFPPSPIPTPTPIAGATLPPEALPTPTSSPTPTPTIPSSSELQPGGDNPGYYCRQVANVQITDLSGRDLGNVIPRNQDFYCRVTSDRVNHWVACGLVRNGQWPLDLCRYYKDYGYQRWEGTTAVFRCNSRCTLDPNCQTDTLDPKDSYELTGFDFSVNCGPYTVKAIKKKVTL